MGYAIKLGNTVKYSDPEYLGQQSCTYTDATGYRNITITNPLASLNKARRVMIIIKNRRQNGYQSSLYLNNTKIFDVPNYWDYNSVYGASSFCFDLKPTDTLSVYTYCVYSSGGGCDIQFYGL